MELLSFKIPFSVLREQGNLSQSNNKVRLAQPATQCYFACGQIWNGSVVTISLAKPGLNAEDILKTCDLFIYGDMQGN